VHAGAQNEEERAKAAAGRKEEGCVGEKEEEMERRQVQSQASYTSSLRPHIPVA
jgi:hypothetical protein